MQNDVALTVKFEIKKRLVLGMKQKILNNFKTTSQHLTQDSVSGDLSSMTNMYLPTYTEYQSLCSSNLNNTSILHRDGGRSENLGGK